MQQATPMNSNDLHFKREVLLHVLYDHDQEWQLYPEGLLGVSGTRDVRGATGHSRRDALRGTRSITYVLPHLTFVPQISSTSD